MAELFRCVITDDDIRRAWRDWLSDPVAEPPAHLVEAISASFVEAAMEDAALTMVRVLLVDAAMGVDEHDEDE